MAYGFPSQMESNTESVPMPWYHNDIITTSWFLSTFTLRMFAPSDIKYYTSSGGRIVNTTACVYVKIAPLSECYVMLAVMPCGTYNQL